MEAICSSVGLLDDGTKLLPELPLTHSQRSYEKHSNVFFRGNDCDTSFCKSAAKDGFKSQALH